AQQRAVRRIDDGVDRKRRDVGDNDLQPNGSDFGSDARRMRLRHEAKPYHDPCRSAGEDEAPPPTRETAQGDIRHPRHGKPAGVLIGFPSEDDWADYRLENNPPFLRPGSVLSNHAARSIEIGSLPRRQAQARWQQAWDARGIFVTRNASSTRGRRPTATSS
ncbi:MAG: hypothetical protein ACREMY_22780, partial [bacterium]